MAKMSEGALAYTQAVRDGLNVEEARILGRGDDLMTRYRRVMEELLAENEEERLWYERELAANEKELVERDEEIHALKTYIKTLERELASAKGAA